ncbi:MAG: metallophosphoesterase [Tepidisphaeraceae bacterium]
MLVTSIATGVGAALGTRQSLATEVASPRQPSPQQRTNALRVAHLTDMHVKPEGKGSEGYAKALRSLAQINPAPQLLITGGDHVMDVLASSRQAADSQWDLYAKILWENTRLKTYPVVGNHDVWGWGAKENYDDENDFGKAMTLDRLKLSQGYYSFDAGAWHFIVLDNIARRGKTYYGDLDAEQTEWLKADLAGNAEVNGGAGEKPVCVISHIPLVSICALFFAYGNKPEGKPRQFWRVGDNLLHRDVKPLLQILAAGNVKLCISGHIHLLDHVEYMGMHFICDGAVSGHWWGGAFQEVAEGYGVFDLFSNGTFEHQYVTYGWEA